MLKCVIFTVYCIEIHGIDLKTRNFGRNVQSWFISLSEGTLQSSGNICKLRSYIYSYNKTNQMHQFLKFIFGIKIYMFRAVPLSIIRSFF